MPQHYFISAYATSQVLHQWDEVAETAYFRALAADPRVIGLEIPYLKDHTLYPIEWLTRNIPNHWTLRLTSLPAVMQLAHSHPKAGLASISESDRKMGVELVEKVQSYAEELQQAFQRSVVCSITLYSSPQSSAASPQGDKEALQRSLLEIQKKKKGSIVLHLEHCDTSVAHCSFEKGFLSLEEEIEVLQAVGGIGLVLNWGRSAIETHSVHQPLQHLQRALASQLLQGFVFSGCTADPESLYGAWKDRHAPPSPLCRESLLGIREVAEVFSLIQEQQQQQECYLGIKVSNRLMPFDIDRSIALNLGTIDLIDSVHQQS
jgi:hypothetical protein